jgi:hypothetical protein
MTTDRVLAPDEFERRLSRALADRATMNELVDLIAWFSRRYPTARDRLAYARRRYAEWTRTPERIAPAEPRKGR